MANYKAKGNPNWAIGIGGNPAGRPKGWQEFRQMCRDMAPEMVQRLAAIANGVTQTRIEEYCTRNGSRRTRIVEFTPQLRYQIEAANSILDRAYGKPAQPLTGEDGEGPVRMAGQIEQIVVHVRHDLVDANGHAKPKVIEHDDPRDKKRTNGGG